MPPKKRKPKFKQRRKFDRTNFKTSQRKGLSLHCFGDDGANYGHIDVTKIEKMFPNKKERLAYIEALIAKTEEPSQAIREEDRIAAEPKDNAYTKTGLYGLMAMAENAGVKI